jgi:ligand-binding sensor domain-containing protein/AraC-like DNA-binding protein
MRKDIRNLLLLACLLTIGLKPVSAQQLQATRHHYSTDDGLASNAIAQMIQDDYGYIWMATWNGLSRFDGYTFYNYQTGPISHIRNLHNRVSQIEVDNQQNIWMRMYDARIFVLKRSTDCIINPFEHISGSEEYRSFNRLAVTSSGDVLVCIDGVGLYKMRMEPNGIKTQLITTGDLVISSIAEGYEDDIWLGTNQGVHRLDASNLTIERKGLFLDEDVTALYSNGYSIFVGTKSGKILSFSYGQDAQVIRSGGSAIANLFVDSHGLIWYTDPRMGVAKIDPDTHVEKFYVQRVQVPDYDGYGGLFTESNGVVWIAMNRGGFGYYNRENDEVEYFHNDPSNPWNLTNTINAMFVTNDGVVFESTTRRGLEKLEIINKTIERLELVPGSTSELDNEIRGILYDKSRKQLLISNKAGMLFVIQDDGSRTVLTNDDSGNPMGRIYGISKDSKGNYWLSSKDNGLFKMTPSNGSYRIVNMRHKDGDENSLSDNRAYYSVEDNDGNIWVATYGGGVNLLPKGHDGFLTPKHGINEYPINSYQKVRTVAVDKDGKVWAGTTDGILLMSYKNGKVDVERLEASEEFPDDILMSNDIVCIERDIHGMMWVGTSGGGLAHTIGQDSKGCWLFEHFGSRDGLPSEEIKSLTFDNRGNVWFATDHNICSFDLGKRIFATYSSLEGVDETICSEASATTLGNGHILFGTLTGYYHVDHDKLVNSVGSILKLRITDFMINDEIQSPHLTDLYDYYVPDSKSVVLPSQDSRFTFRFASLNYQLQHRVQYQYMLEGYDDDWINADKQREATYEDIPSGTYVFKVKAFLLDSAEKFDLREIEVVVPARFLMSKTAIWLYMALGIIVVICFMFWLQRRYRRHETLRQMRKKNNSANAEQREDIEFIERVRTWLDLNYKNASVNLDPLLLQLSMNLADFESRIKRITGKTMREYIIDYRLTKAKQLLEQTNDSIADISFELGFTNAAQFNQQFQSSMGMTPSQYRDKYRSHENNDATTDYEIIEES